MNNNIIFFEDIICRDEVYLSLRDEKLDLLESNQDNYKEGNDD